MPVAWPQIKLFRGMFGQPAFCWQNRVPMPSANAAIPERLANIFVSGDFGRVSCERGATCNIAQPSMSLEEK
mgnify:CR=1 FL=1